MAEHCLSIAECMERHHFSKQDLFWLLDSLVARYGADATPEEIVQKEKARLAKIRSDQNSDMTKVSVKES